MDFHSIAILKIVKSLKNYFVSLLSIGLKIASHFINAMRVCP